MKTSYISVAVINVIVMVCWTALAIHFGKWWIALFAALCFSSLRTMDDSSAETTNRGE